MKPIVHPANPEAVRAYVEGSGLSYRSNSVSWIFTCPRCAKAEKLYIRKRDGRFVCWYCKSDGFEGRPEFALTQLLGIPLGELRAKIYGISVPVGEMYLNYTLKDWWGEGEESEVDDDFEAMVPQPWPYDYYPLDHKFAKKGRDYLEGRGLPLDVAMAYGIRYAPVQTRVAFPIEVCGTLYGWQGRIVGSDRFETEDGETVTVPKITTTKGVQRERLLMFSDRLNGSEHAVLCEGPIDALKAHLCGGNVATMGKSVSREQVELLRNCGIRRLYLALDPDATQELTKLAYELYGDMEVYDMRAPDGSKDLGAMSLEAVHQVFLNAERIRPGKLFVHVPGFNGLDGIADLYRRQRLHQRARRAR